MLLLAQVCHLTKSDKCPWKDIEVNENAVADHVAHGDVIGPCVDSCSGCDEFDEATCRCVFVSCAPTLFPSYAPSTNMPSLSPTTNMPSLSPTLSNAPST